MGNLEDKNAGICHESGDFLQCFFRIQTHIQNAAHINHIKFFPIFCHLRQQIIHVPLRKNICHIRILTHQRIASEIKALYGNAPFTEIFQQKAFSAANVQKGIFSVPECPGFFQVFVNDKLFFPEFSVQICQILFAVLFGISGTIVFLKIAVFKNFLPFLSFSVL